MNYSELLQLAKGWGNFISGRIIIWRLLCKGTSLEYMEKYLWSTIEIFSGYSFTTVKGLRFRYGVNGHEIQINRKKKSITRSSVKVALK